MLTLPDEGGILGPTALPTVLRCLPPFHPVRRAFAPVAVVVVAEDDAKDVVVYGINETLPTVLFVGNK